MNLNKELVRKKLEKVVLNKIKDFDKMHRDHSKINMRNVSGLTYKIRENYFSNSTGSCEFFPERMYAHSYRWYDLLKVIKGKVVLNSYNYSQSTSQHIWSLKTILKDLGIKYIEVDAPRGLQNLDAALAHALEVQAEQVIQGKYARKKATRWTKIQINETAKDLKTLASLGYKATKKMYKDALTTAENDRKSRLERDKARREMKKQMSMLEIVIDSENKMYENAGYHVTSKWGVVLNWEKEHAVNKGFTKIIVHSKDKDDTL